MEKKCRCSHKCFKQTCIAYTKKNRYRARFRLQQITSIFTITMKKAFSLFAKPKQQQDNINKQKTIKQAIDDFNQIHLTSVTDTPCTFTSTVCREQHFRMPLYRYWCNAIKEKPRLHRKQWEFVYICQSLYERGLLKKGIRGIGFGVGKEPLPSLFASLGVEVLASDLDFDSAEKLGWVNTDQHSNELQDLNKLGLCDKKQFEKLVSFRITNGLDFVINSLKTLKPGGLAIHTTEFNLSSNKNTIDNNNSFVIFRRKDIEKLSKRLNDYGHTIEPIDFYAGNDAIEQYIDLPPYRDEPHLRLELANKYTSTSISLIIHKCI